MIAGTGSNDTRHGCALSRKAADLGADALLLVTPYYNKTTKEGLVQHFKAIAESAGLPCIVYNVPSRTGMNIDPETAYELAKNPLICGIKEASGNISQIAKTVALCGDELPLYSGNDDQIVPHAGFGRQGCDLGAVQRGTPARPTTSAGCGLRARPRRARPCS